MGRSFDGIFRGRHPTLDPLVEESVFRPPSRAELAGTLGQENEITVKHFSNLFEEQEL